MEGGRKQQTQRLRGSCRVRQRPETGRAAPAEGRRRVSGEDVSLGRVPSSGVHQPLDLRERDGAERKRGRDGGTETETGRGREMQRQTQSQSQPERRGGRWRPRPGQGQGDRGAPASPAFWARTRPLTTAIGASSPLQTWISGAEF